MAEEQIKPEKEGVLKGGLKEELILELKKRYVPVMEKLVRYYLETGMSLINTHYLKYKSQNNTVLYSGILNGLRDDLVAVGRDEAKFFIHFKRVSELLNFMEKSNREIANLEKDKQKEISRGRIDIIPKIEQRVKEKQEDLKNAVKKTFAEGIEGIGETPDEEQVRMYKELHEMNYNITKKNVSSIKDLYNIFKKLEPMGMILLRDFMEIYNKGTVNKPKN